MSTSIRPRRTPEELLSGSRRWARWRVTLVILELFVGLGGVFGGLEMVRHPRNAFGVTTQLIAGSPFDTFTWPGVILILLLGLTPCLLAFGLVAGWPGSRTSSGLFGLGLVAWIAVQWALLDDRLWLQPAMFIVGGVIAVLGLHRPEHVPTR